LVSRYGSGEDIYNYKKGNKDAKNAAIKSAGTRKAGSIATKAALATAGTAATVGTAVGAAAILSALAKIGLVSAIGTTGAVATGVGLGLANGKVKDNKSKLKSDVNNPNLITYRNPDKTSYDKNVYVAGTKYDRNTGKAYDLPTEKMLPVDRSDWANHNYGYGEGGNTYKIWESENPYKRPEKKK